MIKVAGLFSGSGIIHKGEDSLERTEKAILESGFRIMEKRLFFEDTAYFIIAKKI